MLLACGKIDWNSGNNSMDPDTSRILYAYLGLVIVLTT